jgi:hypothetical protein
MRASHADRMKKSVDTEPARPLDSPLIDSDRFALVWIDSDRASILRWRGRVVTDEVISDVPPHVRGTRHVRRNPRVRHGGSGLGQDDAERRRNEHLRTFLKAVAERLDSELRVEIIGPGVTGQHLAALLARRTTGRPLPTVATAEHSMPLTHRQLAARLRERVDRPPRRVLVTAQAG